jgi:hypothetical protein
MRLVDRAFNLQEESKHEESSSFLKKRTKKLLSIGLWHRPVLKLPARSADKIFWFFFEKKNSFLASRSSKSPALSHDFIH